MLSSDKNVETIAQLAEIVKHYLGAIFCSLAFAFWLASYTGTAAAFLVVGAIHLLLVIIFFLNRKSWIEKPLVRFFANLLLNN